MEYYDWENDVRGNQIKEILLKKASEGVVVRVLYDDYASRKIKNNIVKELKAGGVAVFPKIKVRLNHLANRMNHRDHRKVIIVDGLKGFLGGINISDRYDNTIDTGLWWRDTHAKITGPLVLSLQRHFIISWNASQPDPLPYSQELFPQTRQAPTGDVPALAQVIPGGPIYPMSNIMLSYFKIFTLAREKLYITNPYFIPSDSSDASRAVVTYGGADGADIYSEGNIIPPEDSDPGRSPGRPNRKGGLRRSTSICQLRRRTAAGGCLLESEGVVRSAGGRKESPGLRPGFWMITRSKSFSST